MLDLREVWKYRDVLLMLALRDVKLRYKQTAIGVVWVVLQPVLAGVIFAVIFGKFAALPSDGQPYLLFVLCGLLAWNLFAGVLQRAGNSLVAEARLITKVYFPRVLIPTAAAASAVLDFLVACVVFFALFLWYGIHVDYSVFLLPLAMGLALVLAVGVSLWVSALNVRYRDFGYALPFLIQVWMYASPVVYGISMIPDRWQTLYGLNPMVGIIGLFRDALLSTQSCEAVHVCVAVVVSIAFLVSGALYFSSVEQDFADTL